MRQSRLIITVLAVALSTHAVSQKKGAEGETEGVTVKGNKATLKTGYQFEREGPNLVIARPTGSSTARRRSGRTSGPIIEASCTCQQGSGGCTTKMNPQEGTVSCESSECNDCAIQTHIRTKSPNL